MKVTIIRLPLKQLWNSEYCLFVSQSVAIFLRYQPEVLHLKKAFDRLQALMPELAKIKAMELSNAISIQLADLNNERKTIIKSIMDNVKNYGKMTLPELAPRVALLNRFLDKHGRDLGESNYSSNTERFDDFMADFDSNSEIQNAVSAMQLSILFDQLRTVNTQFATLFMQRSDENSDVETVDNRAIRTEIDKALIAFFDAFEVFSTEYEELDYQTPANKINELITGYKTQLKARTTRRHEGKEVHTEKPISVG